MKRLILTSLLAVFTASGALAQQLTVTTIPGGHDRGWYEHHVTATKTAIKILRWVVGAG